MLKDQLKIILTEFSESDWSKNFISKVMIEEITQKILALILECAPEGKVIPNNRPSGMNIATWLFDCEQKRGWNSYREEFLRKVEK